MLRPGGHGLGDAFDGRTLSKDSVFMIKKINMKKDFPDKTVRREIPRCCSRARPIDHLA